MFGDLQQNHFVCQRNRHHPHKRERLRLGEPGADLGEGAGDDFVHVVVAVFAEASAEDDIGAGLGFGGIFGEEGGGGVGIHGVVRDVTEFPIGRIFAAKDGLFARVDFFTLGVEVFKLMDTGVGYLRIGVVHHSGALGVPDGEGFPFEAEPSPGECAMLVVKVGINGSAIENRLIGRHRVAHFKVIGIVLHGNAGVVEEGVEEGEVALLRDALPGVVEVGCVVVGTNLATSCAIKPGSECRRSVYPQNLSTVLLYNVL